MVRNGSERLLLKYIIIIYFYLFLLFFFVDSIYQFDYCLPV